MAVMHVPRSQAARRHETPPEPAAIKDLLELRDRVDTGRRRAEIIEGRLVVSPMPVIWHEQVCRCLVRAFDDLCDANGWFPDRGAEIELLPTRDRIEPDLLILRDAQSLPKLDSLRPVDRVLLTAEVISASSVREDREVKPHACALAGIPLYLLVDRFTTPLTVSLHSEPGSEGYARIDTVPAGKELRIPAPFDMSLDTSSLPLPQ